MKKRFISLLCAGAMIFGLAGCKSDSVSSDVTESGGAADSGTAVTTAQTEPVQTTTQSTTQTEPAQTTTQTEPAQTTTQTTAQTTTQTEVTEYTTQPENVDEPVEPDDLWDEMYQFDIELEIAEGNVVTSDMNYCTLNVNYVGNRDDAEYIFGSNYILRHWDNDIGDWADVAFAENSAFDMLGHIVGSGSPQNHVTISLNDDFYAEPLEAGSYYVEIEISGIPYGTLFEYKNIDEDTGYVIDGENGSLTLTIDEIKDDRFVCRLPWPYPAVYEVMCDTSGYGDYCVNDTVEVSYSVMYIVGDMNYRLIPTDISMSGFELAPGADYKPVIYLYPEKETEVSVKLDYNGTLTVTDPYYGDGWFVTAKPDGTLVAADGSVYPYLFWEGERGFEYSLTEGTCVSGKDTAAFLDESLTYLGLSDSEKAEFCEFWLPHLEKNPYNVITFRSEDYTDNAKLDISPKPDTIIRVFMTCMPSDEYVEIAKQELTEAPARNGFTVVEWGGAVLSMD